MYLRIEIEQVDDIEQGVFDLSVFDSTQNKIIPLRSGDPVSVGDSMEITVAANDAATKSDAYLRINNSVLIVKKPLL